MLGKIAKGPITFIFFKYSFERKKNYCIYFHTIQKTIQLAFSLIIKSEHQHTSGTCANQHRQRKYTKNQSTQILGPLNVTAFGCNSFWPCKILFEGAISMSAWRFGGFHGFIWSYKWYTETNSQNENKTIVFPCFSTCLKGLRTLYSQRNNLADAWTRINCIINK